MFDPFLIVLCISIFMSTYNKIQCTHVLSDVVSFTRAYFTFIFLFNCLYNVAADSPHSRFRAMSQYANFKLSDIFVGHFLSRSC